MADNTEWHHRMPTDLEPYSQSLMLQRLVLGPTEGNAEAWTLGQCRALLLDEGLHQGPGKVVR